MTLKPLSFALLLAAGTLPLVATAASNAIPVGPNLGYGDASNNHTIYSTTANPSWISGNLHEENNWGMGANINFGLKQNDYNELSDQYKDTVKPILDEFEGSGVNVTGKALETAVNNLVLNVRDSFYVQAETAGSIPFVFTKDKWGGFGIELSGIGTARAKLLSSDKPVTFDSTNLPPPPPGGYNSEDLVNAMNFQSAMYVKTAVYREAAFSYGNQWYEGESGRLSAGFRAKYMQSTLVKSVNSLHKYLLQTAEGNSALEQSQDDLKEHEDISDTDDQIGVDLGVQWFANNWMVGLTVMNVNSPTFKYNSVGGNCANLAQDKRDQCYTENFYSNQIDLDEKVVLDPQGRVEAAYYTENRHWSIAGSVDTNSTYDLVNNEYQWASVSVAYATDHSGSWVNALIPDFRFGYRKNLTGDEKHYYTPGFTWGPLNLDLGFEEFDDLSKIGALTSEFDEDSEVPEALMVSIGLEFYF